MPEVRDWAQMAEWFDAKQGDEGDLWHRALIYPVLLRVIGEVAGHEVLDLACGNGSMSRRLARQGARVTGVDGSAPIIECARRREAASPLGIAYYVSNSARVNFLRDQSFDLVVCTMALIDMDDSDARGTIGEVARLMRPHGRGVLCFSHPCFDVPDASSWLLEEAPGEPPRVARKLSRYNELFRGTARWRLGGGEEALTHAYHRPLAWYFRAIREAGLAVTAFEESVPTAELYAGDHQGEWIARFPLHCVIETRKLQAASA